MPTDRRPRELYVVGGVRIGTTIATKRGPNHRRRIIMPRSITPYFGNRGLGGFEPLFDLHREMNRLFDDAYRGGGRSGGQGAAVAAPRLDVRENDREICISADLPGMDASNVDLRLEGDMLTICGERSDETRQEEDDFHILERSVGRFQRSVQLPFSPDPEQVKAKLQNGVLNLNIPKDGAQQRSHRIALQGDNGKSARPTEGDIPQARAAPPDKGQGSASQASDKTRAG
jgi:HSP20 family protein